MAPPMPVTEDTPPDMLTGSMALKLVLPSGKKVKMSIDRSTPMMDLLVHVTTSHKLSPAAHILQPYGELGVLPYKPSTPIGALDTVMVHIVAKNQVAQNQSNKVAMKQVSQPFEQTYRIQVTLPRNQLYVLRANGRTNMADILAEICREKDLDPNKYSLRHPKVDKALEREMTIAEYRHNQLCLVSNKSRPASHVSTDDIINAIHNYNNNIYSFEPSCRSLSPDSSVSPVAEPAKPLRRKKPPAPKPPDQKNHLNKQQKEKVVNGSTTVICHSRTSSDSSGYHEASLLSESPHSNNSSLPDSLPRRSKLPESESLPGGPLSRSLSNLQVAANSEAALKPAQSTSCLNLQGRKKRPAPAPPAVMRTVQEEKVVREEAVEEEQSTAPAQEQRAESAQEQRTAPAQEQRAAPAQSEAESGTERQQPVEEPAPLPAASVPVARPRSLVVEEKVIPKPPRRTSVPVPLKRLSLLGHADRKRPVVARNRSDEPSESAVTMVRVESGPCLSAAQPVPARRNLSETSLCSSTDSILTQPNSLPIPSDSDRKFSLTIDINEDDIPSYSHSISIESVHDRFPEVDSFLSDNSTEGTQNSSPEKSISQTSDTDIKDSLPKRSLSNSPDIKTEEPLPKFISHTSESDIVESSPGSLSNSPKIFTSQTSDNEAEESSPTKSLTNSFESKTEEYSPKRFVSDTFETEKSLPNWATSNSCENKIEESGISESCGESVIDAQPENNPLRRESSTSDIFEDSLEHLEISEKGDESHIKDETDKMETRRHKKIVRLVEGVEKGKMEVERRYAMEHFHEEELESCGDYIHCRAKPVVCVERSIVDEVNPVRWLVRNFEDFRKEAVSPEKEIVPLVQERSAEALRAVVAGRPGESLRQVESTGDLEKVRDCLSRARLAARCHVKPNLTDDEELVMADEEIDRIFNNATKDHTSLESGVGEEVLSDSGHDSSDSQEERKGQLEADWDYQLPAPPTFRDEPSVEEARGAVLSELSDVISRRLAEPRAEPRQEEPPSSTVYSSKVRRNNSFQEETAELTQVKRSASHVSLLARPVPLRKTSSELNINKVGESKERPKSCVEPQGLQSLQVLKAILPQLSQSQGSLNTISETDAAPTERKEIKEERKANTLGRPAVSLATWGERPKRQVSIKSDRDYVFGGSQAKKEPKGSPEEKREKDEEERRRKEPRPSSVYRSLETGNTRPLKQILEEVSRVPIVRSVELKAPYREEWEVQREIRGVDKLTSWFETAASETPRGDKVETRPADKAPSRYEKVSADRPETKGVDKLTSRFQTAPGVDQLTSRFQTAPGVDKLTSRFEVGPDRCVRPDKLSLQIETGPDKTEVKEVKEPSRTSLAPKIETKVEPVSTVNRYTSIVGIGGVNAEVVRVRVKTSTRVVPPPVATPRDQLLESIRDFRFTSLKKVR